MIDLMPKQTLAFDVLTEPEYSHISELLYGGGAGGGKSMLGCIWLMIQSAKYPGTRWVIGRNTLKTLKETTLNSFFEVAKMGGVAYNYVENKGIKFPNGSEILLKDLAYYPSDPEYSELGSLEITGAFVDECNQITEQAWNVLKSRIRYNLDEYNLTPKILGTCNPSRNWVYNRFYEPWRENKLSENRMFIQSLLCDNYKISKHYKTNLDELDEMQRKRLRDGDWSNYRTGGEFWKQYKEEKHVQPVPFLPDKPVHISVDINVLPYITQTLWQVQTGSETVELRQFGECPARDPENTAVKAAQKVARYLRHLGYSGVVHIYGDASGKYRSAVEKSTFFGKYFEEMRKYFVVNDRVMKSNPSVAMSAAFINEIYEGLTKFSIVIGDNCPLSKQDYNTVKEDMNGGMVKEKVKDAVTEVQYEKNGHLSDAKRYFICKVLEKEYKEFLVKRKKNNIV